MTSILPPHIVGSMCGDCEGLGTLGGSKYLTESCRKCEGSGRIRKDVSEDD